MATDNGKTGKVRAVGYLRVSTEEQAEEGYSLRAQRDVIKAWCTTFGWEIVGWYSDEGRSAYTGERRPGFDRLMREHDQWDVCVAKWLSRFWRRVLPALRWSEEMAALGKDFASVTERIDTTTAMGRAMFQMMLVMAELESGQTSERVSAAMDKKFETEPDTWLARAPLGYSVVNGRLVTNADAPKARRVFELYVRERMSVTGVVAALKREGWTGSNGGAPSVDKVHATLHNPTYAGYVYWRGVVRKNGHAALVSEDEFNRAQIALYMSGGRRLGKAWPLILSGDRLAVKRSVAKGRFGGVYVPEVRPAGLDAMIAHTRRRKYDRPNRSAHMKAETDAVARREASA